MEESRKEKTMRNSIVSIITQICILVISLLTRKVFVIYLNIEMLGYESLFNNIFSLLNVTELGIGSIITFHLYKEFAENNFKEISKLMLIYKWFYRVVALIVLALGGIIFSFLPYIIKDTITDWSYVRTIYVIQLLGVASTYFLVTKRMLFKASQREYRCVQIDLYSKIFVMVGQLISLAVFRSYIFYLLIRIIGAIFANVVISVAAKEEYPSVSNSVKVSFDDIKKRNMLKDVKNFLGHELAYAVYGGTDSIIISTFCSLKEVALNGNYVVVATQVKNLFYYKLLDPVQATIGNFVYSNTDHKHAVNLFNMLDLFCFFFALYISTGFLVLYQPFITVWLGREYLLPFAFVISFSLTTYLQASNEIIYKFRCSFGDYHLDRNMMMLSAFLNVVLSIVFVQYWGVPGVQLATAFAFIPTMFGRTRVVFQKFLYINPKEYWIRQVKRFFLGILEACILLALTIQIPYSISGIIIRLLIWAFVPLVINLIIYYKTKEFKMLQEYLKEMLIILLQKIKH